MNAKKILFINNVQYGTLVDSLKWCELLHDRYKITYICFDDGRKRVNTPGVRVLYIPRIGGKKMRGVLFLLFSALYSLMFKGFVFVIYFDGFRILKELLPFKKLHLDIRSLAVNKEPELRKKVDGQIVSAANIYDSVSAISRGVIRKMELDKKVFLLPLGADQISSTPKSYSNCHLLYVGTLDNRNIIDTVKGVEMFINRQPTMELTYDIVGSDHSGNELAKLKDYVEEHNLNNFIKVHGLVPHNQLKPFFDKCNIGVSYVPIKEYYQFQPPTKTYEYAFSGLATIATSTIANEEIINDSNGVLIQDNPEDFCDGIVRIMKMKFSDKAIRNSVKNYSWSNIVEKFLIPIIEQKSETNR